MDHLGLWTLGLPAPSDLAAGIHQTPRRRRSRPHYRPGCGACESSIGWVQGTLENHRPTRREPIPCPGEAHATSKPECDLRGPGIGLNNLGFGTAD